MLCFLVLRQVSVRANLADLCLRKAKASWAPTSTALEQIFRQQKFTDLTGATEMSGELKSVVLHSMTISSCKSTFPLALGTRITGIDNTHFSKTGECFAHVVLPNTDTHVAKKLQEDDVSLAYEFSRKFPGYTAENLHTKGRASVYEHRALLLFV